MLRLLTCSLLALLAACGGSSGSAAQRAAKAAELGITPESFADADPVLLALASDHASLAAALSLAKVHPKAAKRQLRFEASVIAMDCISEFGRDESGFGKDAFEDYSMRVAMIGNSESPKQWDAFVPEMTQRLKARVNTLVDFNALVPADIAEKIKAGDNSKKTDIGSTPAECAQFAKRLKARRYDFL